MTGLWSIITPEAGTNLITNPSLEVDASGYAASGGSFARAALTTWLGNGNVYGGQITPTAGTNDGAYYTPTALTSGTTYTFSVFVLGKVGVPYQIWFGTTGGALKGTATTFTGTGAWQRVSVTWTADASTTFRLYVTKNNSADTTVFWAEWWQLEAADHVTTYIDGSLPIETGFVTSGCTWNGVAHASTSQRSPFARMGGRVWNLDSFAFFVTGVAGTGVPPVTNFVSEYDNPQNPGGIHQYTHERTRVMTLTGLLMGTSLADLHNKRSNLGYWLRPNFTSNDEPVWIRYAGAAPPVEWAVHYDGGLEGGVQSGFTETCAVRLLAPFPYVTNVLLRS